MLVSFDRDNGQDVTSRAARQRQSAISLLRAHRTSIMIDNFNEVRIGYFLSSLTMA